MIIIKDVTNGTEVTINGGAPKFYSINSDLSIQANDKNIEYFDVITSQGKSLSLPTHYTNITFIDSLGTSYNPTTLLELYSYSSLITGLKELSGGGGGSVNILSGSGVLSDSIPIGAMGDVFITVAGVVLGGDNIVSIKNGNVLEAANVVPISAYVSANNQVIVKLLNQSNAVVSGITVSVSVLTN